MKRMCWLSWSFLLVLTVAVFVLLRDLQSLVVSAHQTPVPESASAPTSSSGQVVSPDQDLSLDNLGKDLGNFIVTAYSPVESGVITRSGLPVGPGTVAVDPKIIPLCSVLWVEGYGYGVALDTGGKIKGRRLDVFFDNLKDALEWGVREVRVRMLRIGWCSP